MVTDSGILQIPRSRRWPLSDTPQLATLSLSLMLRPTVSRPVCRGKSTHLGLTTRFLLLSDSCGFVDVGRSLWGEDVSVFYDCCWPPSAQSFLGPSAVGLATIFYYLRFVTSLFVASYDSQGCGGGIRPRLHPGYLLLAPVVPLITSWHGSCRKHLWRNAQKTE
jgi:hypothetical protein